MLDVIADAIATQPGSTPGVVTNHRWGLSMRYVNDVVLNVSSDMLVELEKVGTRIVGAGENRIVIGTHNERLWMRVIVDGNELLNGDLTCAEVEDLILYLKFCSCKMKKEVANQRQK